MDKSKNEKINEALVGVKGGRAECVSALYREIAPTIRYIALKYLRNDSDADDLVQDFWADIYKIASGFSYATNGFAFVCKVMTRRAINRYRVLHNGREVDISYVDYSEIDSQSDVSIENAELRAVVEKAMAKLDKTEKFVIQETYFEEKTLRAIAAELKISRSQVARIKAEAIEKMKEFFPESRDKTAF